MERGSLLTGIILVLLGVALLANNLGWLDLDIWHFWPLLLIGGGVYEFIRWIRNRENWRALMPATVLTVYGVFFQVAELRSWGIMGKWWPVFLLGPGLGSLLTYFLGKREERYLHSGLVLLGLSGLFLYGQLNWFLPLFLIAMGLYLIFREKSAPIVQQESREK